MPPEALPWIACALLAGVLVGVGALFLLLKRIETLRGPTGSSDKLDSIAASLSKIVDAHTELDLRRVEHALLDIRDGQKRVEDRLLATLEGQRGGRGSAGALEPVNGGLANVLSERIVTRLLALGYERIQFVTPLADVHKLSNGDGEVSIEARRDGAACKGRVVVRGGTIADLQLQSAYSIFP